MTTEAIRQPITTHIFHGTIAVFDRTLWDLLQDPQSRVWLDRRPTIGDPIPDITIERTPGTYERFSLIGSQVQGMHLQDNGQLVLHMTGASTALRIEGIGSHMGNQFRSTPFPQILHAEWEKPAWTYCWTTAEDPGGNWDIGNYQRYEAYKFTIQDDHVTIAHGSGETSIYAVGDGNVAQRVIGTTTSAHIATALAAATAIRTQHLDPSDHHRETWNIVLLLDDGTTITLASGLHGNIAELEHLLQNIHHALHARITTVAHRQ
ncbi:hypothetical protein HY632_00215 [Candidatus Uhrbacteria bacterium]|nr:hypothetical protein [Candidatus Uhrbacteria bacterium]